MHKMTSDIVADAEGEIPERKVKKNTEENAGFLLQPVLKTEHFTPCEAA